MYVWENAKLIAFVKNFIKPLHKFNIVREKGDVPDYLGRRDASIDHMPIEQSDDES